MYVIVNRSYDFTKLMGLSSFPDSVQLRMEVLLEAKQAHVAALLLRNKPQGQPGTSHSAHQIIP